jgi:hypothetical protein
MISKSAPTPGSRENLWPPFSGKVCNKIKQKRINNFKKKNARCFDNSSRLALRREHRKDINDFTTSVRLFQKRQCPAEAFGQL